MDIMKILLQAELDSSKSISNIQSQITKIQEKAKPMKITIDTSGATKNMSQISRAIDDASKLERDWGQAIKMRANEHHAAALKINKSMDANTNKIISDAVRLEKDWALAIKMRMNEHHSAALKANSAMDKERNQVITDTIRLERDHAQAIKMRVNEAHASATQINKSIDDEKRKSEALREQIQLFQRRQEIQAKNIETKYKDTYNVDALAKFRTELQALDATNPKVQSQMKSMAVSLREIGTEARNGQIGMQSLGQSVAGTIQKFAMFAGVNLSIYGLFSSIRKGVKDVAIMDDSLTQIGIVLGKNQQQVSGLVQEYANLAREMKVTTLAISEAAVEFYRQGLNEAETMERMESAIKYAKISNTDFTQSVEILTATVNSMNIDIERATDVFAKVGDSAATSSADIGVAMQKVGGSAGAMGVEFEKLVSWIATVESKTQESAETIGTGFSAILSRMAQMRKKGFDEEDGTQINDVAKALSSIGLELMNSKNEFNDFGDILDATGAKWGSLDDKQKAYIATSLAGVRNQSRFLALMNDYSLSMELYEVAMDSAGATNEKYNIYLQSTAAAMDELKNEAQIFWMNLIDSGTIKTFINAGTEIIKIIDSWVNGFGKVNTVLGFVVPMIGVKLVWAAKAGAIALDIMSVKAIAATAGLALIPIIIGKIINAERKRQELMDKRIDSSETLSTEISSLETLSKKYKELSKVENKSVDQKEELLKIQKELAQLYPELATGIDSEGNKIAESIELTDNLTKSKKDLLEAELLAIQTMANNELPKLQSELDKTQKLKDELITKLKSGDTKTEGYDEYGFWTQIDESEKLANQLQELVEKEKELTEQIDKYKGSLEGYNKLVAERAEAEKWIIAAEIEKQAQMKNSAGTVQGMIAKLKELGFTSDDVSKIMSGNLAEVRDRYDLLTEAQIENYKSITQLDDAAKQHAIARLNNDREMTNALITNTKARIEAIKAEMSALSALTGGKISASIISKPSTSEDMLKTSGSLMGTLGEAARNESTKAQRELVNLESKLKNIDAALANVSSIKSAKIDGATYKGKDSKEKKKKDEYTAIHDIYTKINLELDRNNVLLQLNKAYQDQAGDDIAKKIKLIEKEALIYKDRQGLLHQYNEQLREEAKQLQSELSGIFRFEGRWDDNSMKIVDEDMGKVAGKSKEIEEKFNRIIAIMKELPKGSQEWLNLKKAIEDTGASINELQKQQLSDRLANSKNWIEKRKFYDDWGEDNEIAAWERVRAYIKQSYADRIIDHKEYTDYMLEIDRNLATEQNRIYDEQMRKYEEDRSAWVSARNEELQAQRDRLSALDSIQEAVVAIIRKRGEEEKKVLDKAHNAEMKSLDERHNKRKDMYKEELDDFNKMIQGKIDAIDEQNAEEDYLEDLNKEREKATELQKEIDVLSLDDSLTARNKTIELRKQLADQNDKIAKMQQKKERDVLKKSLQDQMKDKQQDVKERENIADELYNNEKKRLEEEYEINKEYLDRKYSDEKVYAEARESIMRGTVETSKGMFQDIYSAYQEFENKFGKGMGILGNIIKTDFLDQLDKAQQAIRDLEYNNRARDDYRSDYDPGDRDLGWSDPRDDYRPSSGSSGSSRVPNYGVGNATGQAAKDNEAKLREDAKYRASEIKRTEEVIRDRLSAGMSVKDQEAYLKRLMSGSYDNGGKITKTGLTLNQFHGTQSSPEWIFNDSQLKNIIKDVTVSAMKVTMPKVPNVSSMGNAGGNKYEINFDVKGNMDRSILPEVQRMITSTIEKTQEKKMSKWKDVGIRRPI